MTHSSQGSTLHYHMLAEILICLQSSLLLTCKGNIKMIHLSLTCKAITIQLHPTIKCNFHMVGEQSILSLNMEILDHQPMLQHLHMLHSTNTTTDHLGQLTQ
jgi:hypothetical protein